MINPPSTFGQPETAPQTPEPETVEPSRKRTVVIVAAAGVAALAVLGGAAALVLSGGEAPETVAAPPASAAPVEPTVTPSAEVSAPLPTAAVRGRNVFVPLVEEAGGEEGGGGSEAESGAESEPDVSPTAGTGSTRPGTGSGSGAGTGEQSGGAAPVVVYDPVVQDLLDSAITEIARLEAEITALQAELREASDDSDLLREIAALEYEKTELGKTVAGLQEQLDQRDEEDASRLLIAFQDVTGDVLTVVVDGEEMFLEVGVPTEVARSGDTPLELTYLDLLDDSDPALVEFMYVSGVSAVQLGATVSFPR